MNISTAGFLFAASLGLWLVCTVANMAAGRKGADILSDVLFIAFIFGMMVLIFTMATHTT